MTNKSKLLSIFLVLIISLSIFSVPLFAASPLDAVKAEAYVVMDSLTGQVLVEKNMNKKLMPASLTKIMTAALALENLELDNKLTAKDSAVNSDVVPRDTTHISLVDGEVMSVKDLLYATMLTSANDAANVLAEGVSGSLDAFVKLMNKKAKELGCKNTTFVNANGITSKNDSNNVTTAYDMALITKYAIQNAYFKQIISTVTYPAEATNKNTERTFATYHKMIKQTDQFYQYATGGKIGYTKSAKYTAMTTAVQTDKELICIVLKEESGNDRFSDTKTLFDYCFKNFRYESVNQKDIPSKKVQILSEDQQYIVGDALLTLPGEIKFLLHSDLNKKDLIIKDNLPKNYTLTAENGEVYITVDSDLMYNNIASSYLQASSEALSSPVPVPVEEEDNGKMTVGDVVKTILKVIGIIILVLVAGFVILIVYSIIMNNKRRKNRRQRRAEGEGSERAERSARSSSERRSYERRKESKTNRQRNSRRNRGDRTDE